MIRNELKELKQGASKLERKVINVILNEGDNEEIQSFVSDVLNHGCQSGIVGELIYYNDTVEFYNKYKGEIVELLTETMESVGASSPSELFGDKWDKSDPLAEETNNQNLLAWFAFEETTRQLADQLGLAY